MTLSPRALGLASAIVNGGFWFLAVTISLLTGLGDLIVQQWGALYPFFSYTWGGMVIVTVENVLLGFVGGWVFAWLYNRFQR